MRRPCQYTTAGTKVQGILSFDTISRNNLKMCILKKLENSNEFLLWILSYRRRTCISCLFQCTSQKGNKVLFVAKSPESKVCE